MIEASSGQIGGDVVIGGVLSVGGGDGSFDSFRLLQDENFFGQWMDALVIAKTDSNQANPDGGIAFTNVGWDGVVETSLAIRGDGRIGIGTKHPESLLHVAGDARVGVLTITGGADLAEAFPAAPEQPVEPRPGMVLSIDADHPGALCVASTAYDPAVAGVYSGGAGLPTGMVMGKDGCDLTAATENRLPLAMTGRVWVYADESNGAIRPGDRLTTSARILGAAMKATDAERSDGAVIGKAMTPLDAETGMVLVLVNLQ